MSKRSYQESLTSPTGPDAVAVILYTRTGCHLCDVAKRLLAKYQTRYGLQITEVDIDGDPTLQARFSDCVPVITIAGRERFRGRVNEAMLVRTLTGQH